MLCCYCQFHALLNISLFFFSLNNCTIFFFIFLLLLRSSFSLSFFLPFSQMRNQIFSKLLVYHGVFFIRIRIWFRGCKYFPLLFLLLFFFLFNSLFLLYFVYCVCFFSVWCCFVFLIFYYFHLPHIGFNWWNRNPTTLNKSWQSQL